MKKVYVSNNGRKKENADKARIRMRLYARSKKGMAVRAKYNERNKERLKKYMRDYFQKRRAVGLQQGLCGNCLKRKRIEGITFCKTCRDMVRKNASNNKKYIKKVKGGDNMEKKAKKNPSKKELEAGIIWEAMKRNGVRIYEKNNR